MKLYPVCMIMKEDVNGACIYCHQNNASEWVHEFCESAREMFKTHEALRVMTEHKAVQAMVNSTGEDLRVQTIATMCKACDDGIDEQAKCKFYHRAKWEKRCSYLRDTGMCDKLVVEGREVN